MTFSALEESRHSGTPVDLILIQGSGTPPVGPLAYNNGTENIVRAGITFYPWPFQVDEISNSGSLDNSNLGIRMAQGSPFDDVFRAYPPSQVINLTVFQGHMADTVTPANFPAAWIGRVAGAGFEGNETVLSCIPISSVIQRPGLRRAYQLGCPHVLYGPQCRASKAAATVSRTANGTMTDSRIRLNAAVANRLSYRGGLVEWTHAVTGRRELRTIASVSLDGTILTIRGPASGVVNGTALAVSRGCNRLMSGCAEHGNILNYGGQPLIPLENPMSSKNQFY